MYSGTRWGSNFHIKDKTNFDHKYDLVYYVKCPKCQEGYIREIGRRLHEWNCDHSRKDSKSHISIYFEMVILKANLYEKYQKHCLLKNYIIH